MAVGPGRPVAVPPMVMQAQEQLAEARRQMVEQVATAVQVWVRRELLAVPLAAAVAAVVLQHQERLGRPVEWC